METRSYEIKTNTTEREVINVPCYSCCYFDIFFFFVWKMFVKQPDVCSLNKRMWHIKKNFIFIHWHFFFQLSFMMKIIPSPDWFIGVNSLDLCAHGRWKNKVHVDLTPFDAGTDQGLTFTAPNWPNTPQIPISAITSSFPDHPASSFLYPEFKVIDCFVSSPTCGGPRAVWGYK